MINSGLMMLIGSYLGREDIWVHGALVECGFELVDLIFLSFDMDVWGIGAVKPEIKNVLIFHHLPGLSLVIPVSIRCINIVY